MPGTRIRVKVTMPNQGWSVLLMFLTILSCKPGRLVQTVHEDRPFTQDFSVKHTIPDTTMMPVVALADRNGAIKLLCDGGLFQPGAGAFLNPGTYFGDSSYKAMSGKTISGLTVYKNQFVYLDNKAVFSNAWAGSLFVRHTVPHGNLVAGGSDFDFLIAGETLLQYVKGTDILWQYQLTAAVKDIQYNEQQGWFWILTAHDLYYFNPVQSKIASAFAGADLRCFGICRSGLNVAIGNGEGYLEINAASFRVERALNTKLPSTDLTSIREINGRLWFGSLQGAFSLREDSRFDYYASKRWLPHDQVIGLAPGPDSSVLVLTRTGTGQICFRSTTLAAKAGYYENQVRQRHIRHGFNALLNGMRDGTIGTGRLDDSDNDGLWTSMYLGGQAFRYAATGSPEALQNCRESLDAMERLYAINPQKGYPARSFERTGYWRRDAAKWLASSDPEWRWKSYTSSDEVIGHVFAFGVIADVVKDSALRSQAVRLLDSLMQHIVENDLYMVDIDGKPTLWGKWNPTYVNARPKMVGDRKINSSNIIAMLQTAYHFTHKELYKETAFRLMQEHGYLENLMRPMKEIGPAPAEADEWSRMLSKAWNHSDDEMYFLGYWGLYRYAFNDTLKQKFREAIIDHWEIERPEKDALWNIMTAVTGAKDFDLEASVWYLQEFPLDLISWTNDNSLRKDIERIPENFRGQTTKEVLPPDELSVNRHNMNRFSLSSKRRDGSYEHSAGDIWLLPYWMARYLGVITDAAVPQEPNHGLSLNN